MVAGSEVQFGEETGAIQLIQQLIDDRYRKLVLDGDKVESMVVDTKMPSTIMLLDEWTGDENADEPW
jgi:hypothetical protein